jgi:hypothetical protein
MRHRKGKENIKKRSKHVKLERDGSTKTTKKCQERCSFELGVS